MFFLSQNQFFPRSGLDEKGREYQQRLYSIASTRYGDDGTGTSVSLCVRRAVFADPETGLEATAPAYECVTLFPKDTSMMAALVRRSRGRLCARGVDSNSDVAEKIRL